MDAHVDRVGLVQEVDDDHIELLAVTVAAAYALLDALRVPRQVIVHDQIAELHVDAFGCRLGRQQYGRLIAEVLDKGRAHVGCRRAGDAVGASVLLLPLLIDLFGERVGVRAVEHHDLARELRVLEDAEQVVLRLPGTQ